jgi:outer membrane protein
MAPQAPRDRSATSRRGSALRQAGSGPPRAVALLGSILIVAAVSATRAQEPPPAWTLATAVEAALAHAPALEAARAGAGAAAAELREARAERAPAASLGASAFRYQEPMVVTPIHGFAPGEIPEFDHTLLQAALQVRWELWDGGGRAARVEQRERELDAAEAGLEADRQAVAARAASAYLRVTGLASTLEAHGERLVAVEAERERVTRLLASGKVAEVDLRRIEAALAAAEAQRVALGAALEVAERDLARLLGVEPEAAAAPRLAPVRAAGPAGAEREAILAALAERSPALERARAEVAAADAAVEAARAARLPSARLEGNYLGFGDGDLDGTAEWNAGVRVALPLGDRRLPARLARAEAAASGAAARLRALEDALAGEVDRALAARAETLARVTALEAAAASAAEVVRIERLRLDAGAGIEADYLEAEAELLALRAQRIEAEHAAVIARVELARLAGELSAGWIAAHLQAGGTGEREP